MVRLAVFETIELGDRIMAKTTRKSTVTVVESVQGSADAKAHAALLSSIPNPTFAEIPFSALHPDRTFNVREESSYTKAANPELYTSLKEVGFDRSKPMMAVSIRPDGTYLLLRGYVRHAMMTLIREEVSKANAALIEAGKASEATPMPFETIPVAVYGDRENALYLSRDQETAIMADHTGSRPLNNFERCTMIGRAWEAALNAGRKLSDKALSANLGVSEATAQRDRYTYQMPTVYENLRKQVHNEDGVVKVVQDDLHKLYKAYLDDQSLLNKPRTEGVNFRRAWEEVKSKATAANDPKVKVKTPTEIANAVKALDGYDVRDPETKMVRDALAWFLGEPSASMGGDLEEIVKRRKALENAVATLTDERDRLKMELAEVSAERDNLRSERDMLARENEALLASDKERD